MKRLCVECWELFALRWSSFLCSAGPSMEKDVQRHKWQARGCSQQNKSTDRLGLHQSAVPTVYRTTVSHWADPDPFTTVPCLSPYHRTPFLLIFGDAILNKCCSGPQTTEQQAISILIPNVYYPLLSVTC